MFQLMQDISLYTCGICPRLAATNGILPPVIYEPFKEPAVERQTASGINQAKPPNTRFPNVTATAFDDNISEGDKTEI